MMIKNNLKALSVMVEKSLLTLLFQKSKTPVYCTQKHLLLAYQTSDFAVSRPVFYWPISLQVTDTRGVGVGDTNTGENKLHTSFPAHTFLSKPQTFTQRYNQI